MESTIKLSKSVTLRIRDWSFIETLLVAQGGPNPDGCFTRDEEVPPAERSRTQEDDMQEQLRIHRQILYDLALHYLEPLNGSFARLAYLASLKNQTTKAYAHERLSALYGQEPVREALANCHEELFERLLELPLAQQEKELRQFIGSLPHGGADGVRFCQERFEDWIPAASPDYLKELFRSNLNALLGLLRERNPKARSDK
jgi:hypothetical protein